MCLCSPQCGRSGTKQRKSSDLSLSRVREPEHSSSHAHAELLQSESAGADAVEDEAALDAELAALRGGIADARRGLAAGRAELRVMDRDLAAAGPS